MRGLIRENQVEHEDLRHAGSYTPEESREANEKGFPENITTDHPEVGNTPVNGGSDIICRKSVEERTLPVSDTESSLGKRKREGLKKE